LEKIGAEIRNPARGKIMNLVKNKRYSDIVKAVKNELENEKKNK
jgi:hypothetical protein